MNKSNKDGIRNTMYKLIFLFKNVFFECHKHNWLSMNIRVFHTLYKLVKKNGDRLNESFLYCNNYI